MRTRGAASWGGRYAEDQEPSAPYFALGFVTFSYLHLPIPQFFVPHLQIIIRLWRTIIS